MHYEGECAVPDCGRPGRDYHGDGQEIICYEHYLYDQAVLRRSQTIQQVREGTLHTEIAYDRQEKRYRLVAANGVELGSYRQRREAEEARLALEAPQVLELARRAAERYPVLAGRALRAAQLVAAGKVHLDTTLRQACPERSRRAQGSACHRVASQTCPEPSRRNGAGEYQVEQTDGTLHSAQGRLWRCTCPDWQGSFNGEPFSAPVVGRGPKCKHILAVLMAIKLGQGDKGTRRQGDTSSPRLPLSPSPCLSWWDHQQALARFQEYARRVHEEGADPRLLFVLSQML